MSPDETFLVQLLAALHTVRLEYIVVGTTAASIQAAPVMTQHVDILVRDTPLNRVRVDALAREIGAGRPVRVSDSTTLSLVGGGVPVDVLRRECETPPPPSLTEGARCPCRSP